MKLWIHGGRGRLGSAFQKVLDPHWELVGISHRESPSIPWGTFQWLVDVSGGEGFQSIYDSWQNQEESPQPTFLLVASTGIPPQFKDPQIWKSRNLLTLLWAPNTSLMMLWLSGLLPPPWWPCSVEIRESHHAQKKDAPSGTALMLADRLGYKGPIQSFRGGHLPGEHVLRFVTQEEELIITHRAWDRTLFAKGLVVLGRWLLNQSPGFYENTNIPLKELRYNLDS